MKGRGVWEKEARILRRNHDSTKEEIRGTTNGEGMINDNDQLAGRVEEIT